MANGLKNNRIYAFGGGVMFFMMLLAYPIAWYFGHIFLKNNYYSDLASDWYEPGTTLVLIMCFMFANISLTMALPCVKEVN